MRELEITKMVSSTLMLKTMSLKAMLGGLGVVALALGCGPRLQGAAEVAQAPAAEAPVAEMVVQLDAAKLDAERKYKEAGQFAVDGLFYKDGASQPATVKVTLQEAAGRVARAYDIDLSSVAGSSAKVEMWDDGFLSVAVPDGAGTPPLFSTSNANVKVVSLEVPGMEPRTCYFGKQILDGQIRFALCDLQSPQPMMAFVDAVPEAPASGAAPKAPAPPSGAAPEAPATATP
jgi:hypothetical protein